MIHILLGRFTKATAEDLASPPDAPGKKDAAAREAEIEAVLHHPKIQGRLERLYWTLGDYDVVAIIEVASAEKAGAAALAIATRVGIATTTLSGFDGEALQRILDDGGYAGHG